MYGKKRPIQHRVDDDGLDIFRSSLPHSKTFSMVFSEELKDYGIDGQLQIFINEHHTGEFLKVQIKSKDKGKYTNKGKTLSLSLDLDSAFFLVEEVQDPTTLIVVDNDSKRVFWYPIQTSTEAKIAVDQQLGRNNQVDNPNITIHIDVENNQLTPDNHQRLYEYFKEAKLKLSEKSMLRIKTDHTLSAGVQHINDIEAQMLQLPGFDWKYRQGMPLTPGTVFSLENSNGKKVDFVPSKEYKPELAPTIKLTARFSTKSKNEQKKFEAFRKAVQDGIGSIDLDSTNIDAFEVMVGSQLFDKKVSSDNIKISIGPTKKKLVVSLSNGVDELEHPVEIWVEDGAFIISSVPKQGLSIRMNFKVDNLNGKFNIGINPEFIPSASHQLRLLDFIRNTKLLVISFVDNEGFKRKLFGGDLDTSAIVSDDQYNFAKALAEIEQSTGILVPFPLPDDIKMEDINNVFWVHRILTQGKIIQKITLSFSLKNIPPENVEKDKYMSMTQTPPEIYLFGKPYIMPGFTQTIAGKITKLETPEGKVKPSYKLEMEEAEISIKKTNT